MTKEAVFIIGLILGIIIIVILAILWNDSFNNGTEKNAYKNHCYAFHFNNDYVWGSIHT